MSTGSELLHKLRSQREINSNINDCNSTSAVRYVTPLAASTFYKSNGASPLRQNEIHQPSSTTTTIEVCLGPDCSGSGGGAALLEIEELVSATFRKNCVGVSPGGCRDYCTMGPNIYVKQFIAGSNITTTSIIDEHYSKVNNPEACRSILASLFPSGNGSEKVESTNNNSTSIYSILQRREDGIRWRSHKKRAAMEHRLRVRKRL